MKQGSFRAVRRLVFLLVMMSMAGFSAFGNPVSMMSIVVDPFDGSTTHQWTLGGRTYTHEFEWALEASRFATRSIDNDGNEVRFPLQTIVPSFPMALFGNNRAGRDLRSFGIWGRFDRQGHNWIDVYPVSIDSGESFEIPIPGRLQNLDMWIWGSNHHFYIEAFVRDHTGAVHSLNMGDLAFQGWRNLSVNIPASIPQVRRTLPAAAALHFVKFRIWTVPTERVGNFYIYFNQFKILTDAHENLFDGDELADPVMIQEFWMQN